MTAVLMLAGFVFAFILTMLAAGYFAVVGSICVEFFCHSFRFKARTIYLILMGSFLAIGFLWSQEWAVAQFLPLFFLAIAPVRAMVFFLNKKTDYLNQFLLYKTAVLLASLGSLMGLGLLAYWAWQNLPGRM